MNQTIDQTRDLLAAADPAPAPVAYSEERVRAMTRSIVASASHAAQPSPWVRVRRVAIGLGVAGAVAVGGATAYAGLRPAGEVAAPPLAEPIILNGVGPGVVPIPEAPEGAVYLKFELACFEATICMSPAGGVTNEAHIDRMVERGAVPVTDRYDPINPQKLAPLDDGLPIEVDDGAHWRLYAVFAYSRDPQAGRLEDGRTLGIPGVEVVDLVPATATNGETGWVDYVELTTRSNTSIQVYDQDGETVLGEADLTVTVP